MISHIEEIDREEFESRPRYDITVGGARTVSPTAWCSFSVGQLSLPPYKYTELLSAILLLTQTPFAGVLGFVG